MAKTKRRLKSSGAAHVVTASTHVDGFQLPKWVRYGRWLATAFLGSMLVYVAYHPSDSILVEQGDALWFCVLALVTLTLTVACEPMFRSSTKVQDAPGVGISRFLGSGLLVDLLVWNLASWVMIAAFATCPPGNLRMATNEAWLWIAGAAVITSARRLLVESQSRAMALTLMLATSAGLAAHAMHQEKISLPKTRAAFVADPDRVLRDAGIDAPRLSSRRMIFSSRLMDGGPTATYALANSLAAALMASVLIPLGILRRVRERGQAKWWVVFWLAVICLGAAAIIATRSRSALLAVMAGVAFWFIRGLLTESRETDTGYRRRVRLGIRFAVGLALVAACIVGGVALFGDDEWMAAAPASLEFRLQYWRSTLQMLADHPLMGSGPGNFQSMYLRYRLPIADETIADPHNFVFETLSTGGYVAGALLVIVFVLFYRESNRHADISQQRQDPASPFVEGQPESASFLLAGAVIAFVLIWLLGLAANRLPDVPASVLAVPVALITGWLAWRTMKVIDLSEQRAVVGALLTAILVHLLVSGGWTVPGISLLIWISVSMLVPSTDHTLTRGDSETDSAEQHVDPSIPRKLAVGGFLIGLTLLAALRFVSIGPVQASQFAQQRAEFAAQQGIQSRADEENQRAVEEDRWAFEAALWRSEWLLGRLLQRDDGSSDRQDWQFVIEETHKRSGQNPLVMRAIGEQYLRLYQRFGKRQDLSEADRWMSLALTANPTDASLTAQVALIAAEESDFARFETLRDRAWELSLSAKNLTRHLDVKFVFMVRPVGAVATSRGLMDRASALIERREAEQVEAAKGEAGQ